VHEVAESRSSALAHLVLSTTSLSEVGDGREFGVDWTSSKPPIVEFSSSTIGVFLATEFDVNIAHEVIAEVVADVHLLNLAIFVLQLNEYVLEKVVVMLLHLLVGHIGDH
jgi:hypothetical protein